MMTSQHAPTNVAPLFQPDRRPTCDARCLDVRAVDPATGRLVWITVHDLDVHTDRTTLPSPAPVVEPDRPIIVGDLLLDPVRHEARIADRQVRLTQVETRILTHLARHAGQVCSYTTILMAAWPAWFPTVASVAGISGERDMLRAHMARLRNKVDGPGRPHLRGGQHHHSGTSRITTHRGGLELVPSRDRSSLNNDQATLAEAQ